MVLRRSRQLWSCEKFGFSGLSEAATRAHEGKASFLWSASARAWVQGPGGRDPTEGLLAFFFFKVCHSLLFFYKLKLHWPPTLLVPGTQHSDLIFICITKGFPDSSAGKESACNAGHLGLIPGLGTSPGEGKSYLLQYLA